MCVRVHVFNFSYDVCLVTVLCVGVSLLQIVTWVRSLYVYMYRVYGLDNSGGIGVLAQMKCMAELVWEKRHWRPNATIVIMRSRQVSFVCCSVDSAPLVVILFLSFYPPPSIYLNSDSHVVKSFGSSIEKYPVCTTFFFLLMISFVKQFQTHDFCWIDKVTMFRLHFGCMH